jgi:hypothetical protein
MSKHVTLSPNEAADRLAIRELVEAYPFSDHRGTCYLRHWIAFRSTNEARELRDADVVVIDLFQILSAVNCGS